MNATTFLLLNLALAFYNVGTIGAREVDIFRTWRLSASQGALGAWLEPGWRGAD